MRPNQQVAVSVIVPVRNGAGHLARCLMAICASTNQQYECVVVDDSSTDETRAVAAQFPVTLIELRGGPYGPAQARNLGVQVARGAIILFVDADVVVKPDTVAQVVETFGRSPEISAVFGSYDDAPANPEFLSQYKNLFHHFVHQHASEQAVTFWAGCGAVRRDAFLAVGGFDAQRYPRPSIEDIELGARLRSAGHRIMLHKGIQVTHLKRWTLRGIVRSDVFDRGIPWTLLLLQERSLPNDLNLRISQRAGAILACLLVTYAGLILLARGMAAPPLLVGLFMLLATAWSRDPPHVRLAGAGRVLAYALLGLIAWLALLDRRPAVLASPVLFFGGMLADRWLPGGDLARRVSLGGMVLGFVGGMVPVAAALPAGALVPGGLILLFLLLINYQLYAFFFRQRGLAFTVAVLPFHLLYYVYGLVAFALGVGLYRRRPITSRTGPPDVAAPAAMGTAQGAKPVAGRWNGRAG